MLYNIFSVFVHDKLKKYIALSRFFNFYLKN